MSSPSRRSCAPSTAGTDELAGRYMLLEGRFFGLRFYLGVRITRVTDETRDGYSGERVWGWSYQTLQGHLEQGRLSYEVIKNLASGQVTFRVPRLFPPRTHSQPPDPHWVRPLRPVDTAALLPSHPGTTGPARRGCPAPRAATGTRSPARWHRHSAVLSRRASPGAAGTRLAPPRQLAPPRAGSVDQPAIERHPSGFLKLPVTTHPRRPWMAMCKTRCLGRT